MTTPLYWELQTPLPPIENLIPNLDKSQVTIHSHSRQGDNDKGKENIDLDWLLKECEAYSAAQTLGITSQVVYLTIIELIKSRKPENEFQNALLDLVGFEDLDWIESKIRYQAQLYTCILQQDAIQYKNLKESTVSNIGNKMPIYGAQVTVSSDSQKKLLKEQRKKLKKLGSKVNKDVLDSLDSIESCQEWGLEPRNQLDGQSLKQLRQEELLSNASSPLYSSPYQSRKQPKYPYVFQSGSGGSVLSVFGNKFSLPVGSTRQDNTDYEQICIPISTKKMVVPNERLVKIQELPSFAQSAFSGYKSLNRVQSLVYPIAFGSNENMLVCAPTGAGKTDIAMLTVLKCIDAFRSQDPQPFISKNDFKIVYVAPMKALATEIARKFDARLRPLGIKVSELTGDMQLTKNEISNTQMLIVTPEKFDVVTRKSVGDTELTLKVRLLILDEVHLLNEDRGSVIESIVARTLRLVESSQSMIRIVGLSATLPNYVDVAKFLGVNLYKGLFYFDSSFRPVPLEQNFIGVKTKGSNSHAVQAMKMNSICYEKVSELVKQGHQVMVFVHSRKDTVKTAQSLKQESLQTNESLEFSTQHDPQYSLYAKQVRQSKNKELKELYEFGFSIHHAGMSRSDRLLTEKLFEKGLVKVLCCTATLAWGVNLPAYAVVIKGTQVYDATKGSFVDLSILDVLQIFGRAGRPQYEDKGVGYILTTHDKLSHYISLITQQFPIESRFMLSLMDNLNAEIALGTVTNVEEGIRWLSYTYLYVRMSRNPFQYGLDWSEIEKDPLLVQKRSELITLAASKLHKAQMIVYDEQTGFLSPKDLGRTSSSFYIRSTSIEIFNSMMTPRMTEADVLSMVSMSTEFENIKVREEELFEMKKLQRKGTVCDVKGDVDSRYGKSNILLQNYISHSVIEDFALVSDTLYVAQNAARILRGLFHIALSRNYGPTASVILSLCKSVDKRMWSFDHPLIQFGLPWEIQEKLNKQTNKSIEFLREMDGKEIGQLIRHEKYGSLLHSCSRQFPILILESVVSPITRSVLRIKCSVTADFVWNDKIHGSCEPFWIWVQDSENTEILYSEFILFTKKQYTSSSPLVIEFTIPVPRTESTVDALPPQIYIRALSDRWIGSETVLAVSFKHLILPSMDTTGFTDLLDLQPLPISALKNPLLQDIYKYKYFNPVQTQIFHTLYHSQDNVLVGAPTGSGKTVAAELALFAAFRDFPSSKVVYIAPLKALVKERVKDWTSRIAFPLGRNLVELTGDVTPDIKTIQKSDIIITTPEKWDGISRHWKARNYVQSVSLVIIDEIHLLGNERGPILEVIVSRMNFISSHSGSPIRILGLSTALANAHDLAQWLHIKESGLFNFRHNVRPVPLEIYIDGFPGKHYCPRMMSMNKPAYKAIMTHSPDKPVIIFVSSRRQTRLTAQDLISLCANDDVPRRFLLMDEYDLSTLNIQDPSLKHSLGFGIGLHHAGLIERDRQIVEELFVNNKIQILVATSTLAWGVNFPAHMVIVKGTEYYDAKTKGYVDYPITDVLQMIGRAGRIQFSDSGVARIFVLDSKKDFYKKFLYEPFPVESHLHTCLHDHLNAEIVSGSITSKQDCIDYLTWTYFYQRLLQNPTFYGSLDASEEQINTRLSGLIESTLSDLESCNCIQIQSLGLGLDFTSTPLGRIASMYYLHYTTIALFNSCLFADYDFEYDFYYLLRLLSDSWEYNELPVRHNEDLMNKSLEQEVRYTLDQSTFTSNEKHSSRNKKEKYKSSFTEYDDSHVKAFLLLEAHLDRLESLPCSDYKTDMNSVLDQSIRILQAMIETCVLKAYLQTCIGVIHLLQSIKQGRWIQDSSLLCLPHMTVESVSALQKEKIYTLVELYFMGKESATYLLDTGLGLSLSQTKDVCKYLFNLPIYSISYSILSSFTCTLNKKGNSPLSQVQQVQEVMVGKEYSIQFNLSRISLAHDHYKVSCPQFPKPQYEGWFLLLENVLDTSLVGFKRIPTCKRSMQFEIKCLAPTNPGEYHLKAHFMSDGYIGVDQVIDIYLNVI